MSSFSHVESLEQRRMFNIVGFPSAAGDTRLLGVADFNIDGQDDLVWVNDSTGAITIDVVTNASATPPTLTPEGTPVGTTSGSATFLAFGVGSFKPGADLDPTHPDILFWDSSLRKFGWWTTSSAVADGGWGWVDGDTVLGGSAVGAGWTPLAAGDLDGNGFDDIFFRNDSTGDTGVWYLEDGAVINADILGPGGTNWRIASVADLDDDGTAEILWNNSSSGALVAWVLDSTTYHFDNAVLDYGTTASATWVAFATGSMDGTLHHNDILIQNIDNGDLDALVLDNAGGNPTLKQII